MIIEFGSDKDAINRDKHGMSLADAVQMADIVVVPDDRFAEERFRLYGAINGVPHCAAVVFRGDHVRIISLRRAHRKEFRRHV